MGDDKGSGLVAAFAVLFLALVASIFWAAYEAGRQAERTEAVRAGAASYDADRETSEPKFRYLRSTR